MVLYVFWFKIILILTKGDRPLIKKLHPTYIPVYPDLNEGTMHCGLKSSFDPRHTRAGPVIGFTVNYASPESENFH